MANIVPLNSEAHRSIRIRAGFDAHSADLERFVPVTVSEFAQLVAHCPIVLTKNGNTGEFIVGAVLGFEERENLFLDEPVVFEEFRPLNLRRLPFYALGSEMGIDLDSPRLVERGGEPIFDEDGKPTGNLVAIMGHLRDLSTGAEQTRAFIHALASLRLIEPIAINLQFDDGRSIALEDVFTVNREVLSDLPDEVVLQLFRSGFLQLIHYMSASLGHFARLAERKNRKLSAFSHG